VRKQQQQKKSEGAGLSKDEKGNTAHDFRVPVWTEGAERNTKRLLLL